MYVFDGTKHKFSDTVKKHKQTRAHGHGPLPFLVGAQTKHKQAWFVFVLSAHRTILLRVRETQIDNLRLMWDPKVMESLGLDIMRYFFFFMWSLDLLFSNSL